MIGVTIGYKKLFHWGSILKTREQNTASIERGCRRVLRSFGMACVSELPLPNGRRADILALDRNGMIWIIEIKSGVEDFRADQKWQEYLDYCDRFFFAVSNEFPIDILPRGCGLIIADRYGGEMLREAAENKLAGGRRKAILLRFARTAADRLHCIIDPEADSI